MLTYALIRPRLGPGVNTAICAGLILWFAAYFYVGIINGVLFGLSIHLLGLSLVWGLVQYVLAAILVAGLQGRLIWVNGREVRFGTPACSD